MMLQNLFLLFTTPLNDAKIQYAITGSVAAIAYGEPRLTHDIDIVLTLMPAHIENLQSIFPENDFYCPPLEVIEEEVRRSERGHFNIIHHQTGFKADIYLAGEDPLISWAINNRKKIQLEDDLLWLAPPEYVVAQKLRFYREGRSEKHLRDVSSILNISKDDLDFLKLDELISSLNLSEYYQLAVNFKGTDDSSS